MDKNVEQFIEDNNMTYLYLLLAELEKDRLLNLPDFVKKKLDGKITEVALAHVAKNNIPDYITEESEDDSEEF